MPDPELERLMSIKRQSLERRETTRLQCEQAYLSLQELKAKLGPNIKRLSQKIESLRHSIPETYAKASRARAARRHASANRVHERAERMQQERDRLVEQRELLNRQITEAINDFIRFRDTYRAAKAAHEYEVSMRAGIPEVYLAEVFVTYSNGVTHIYFGGEGYPNGPGHAHYVLNANDVLVYKRNPGEPHGPHNHIGTAIQAENSKPEPREETQGSTGAWKHQSFLTAEIP